MLPSSLDPRLDKGASVDPAGFPPSLVNFMERIKNEWTDFEIARDPD
jgi:hypothetical protein